MLVQDWADPAGSVQKLLNGDLFLVRPATAGSYADGSFWEEVEPAAGGPGTGTNGGGYQPPAGDPKTAKAKVHKQFKTLDGPGVLDALDDIGVKLPPGVVGTTEAHAVPTGAEGHDGLTALQATVNARTESGNPGAYQVQSRVGNGAALSGLPWGTPANYAPTGLSDVQEAYHAPGGGGGSEMIQLQITNTGGEPIVVTGVDLNVPAGAGLMTAVPNSRVAEVNP